jgi:hypothetical protein
MASSHRTIAMRTAIAAVIMSFAAIVYSVGPISSWLRSERDAAISDANAEASDSGAVKTVGPSGLQSVVLSDKGNCNLSQEVITVDFEEFCGHPRGNSGGTYQRPQSL